MAVNRWSAEALAEMRSVQAGMPAPAASQVRTLVIRIANEAGRQQVERTDVAEALAQYFRVEAEEPEAED
jgi:hypothetical protein